MQSSLISQLRSDLASAGFTVDALGALWGEESAAALHRGHRLPALRALESVGGGGPLGTLASLFVLGVDVAASALQVAFPSLTVEGALELGLVSFDGERVRPRLDLRPYAFVDAIGAGHWWIASDLGEIALGTAIPESHVLGVGGASTTLSGLLITTSVDSVLDLGTGCGIQAMHASRFAARVVATDVSTRALDIAEFNAHLNGISGIEFRLGSLFEPVAGERFDRIISNPPFVITPRAEGVPAYEYRDGGLEGDTLVETVVREASAHLAPGGIVQLLANWEYRNNEEGLERVAHWGAELDLWVIERETQDVAQYAETWIRDGGTKPQTPQFDLLYAAWLDDFARRGVRAIGFGYVTGRDPRGTVPFRRLERLPGALGRNDAGLGQSIAASLDAQEWLGRATDEQLLATSFTVAGDVTEERHYWPGDEHPTVIDIRQGGGFGRTIPAGTALAAVVGVCDGDLTLGAICGAIAQLLEVDAVELQAEVLPSVRELVFVGVLAR